MNSSWDLPSLGQTSGAVAEGRVGSGILKENNLGNLKVSYFFYKKSSITNSLKSTCEVFI